MPLLPGRDRAILAGEPGETGKAGQVPARSPGLPGAGQADSVGRPAPVQSSMPSRYLRTLAYPRAVARASSDSPARSTLNGGKREVTVKSLPPAIMNIRRLAVIAAVAALILG